MLHLIWIVLVGVGTLLALGFAINIGGALIHLLVVLALLGFVYNVAVS